MTNAIADDVLAHEDRRWAAQIDKDLDTLRTLYADEMSYTHSNGFVDTKSSFLDAIRDRKFDYRSAERLDETVTVIGDTAMITGRAKVHVVAGGRDVNLDARFTVIWVRRDGAWQFLCWQSTSIAKP
ncbi:MAG: nuclear transport factor 2 family protein [Acidimicrobiia bacterium]|nr:nuclear transport factor 2 family protein [Acidimicrobiia bacterium]